MVLIHFTTFQTWAVAEARLAKAVEAELVVSMLAGGANMWCLAPASMLRINMILTEHYPLLVVYHGVLRFARTLGVLLDLEAFAPQDALSHFI